MKVIVSLTDFAKNINWTFYSAEMNFLPKIFQCYNKNYIMEIASYEEALKTLEMFKSLNCWNPNQRIFIFSSKIKQNHSAEFLDLISLTQNQLLNNVVIMIPVKARKLEIYYWASEDNEKCVQTPKLPHFFSCEFGRVSGFQEKRKRPSECYMNVKAVVYPPYVVFKGKETVMTSPLSQIEKLQLEGFEIELMNLISALMKIDIHYFVSTKEDWGRSFFNGSATKSMEDLVTRKIDIVIGSMTPSLSRYLLFEMSMPYTEAYLVCCIPHQGQFEIFTTFFSSSNFYVYFPIYLIYILLTVAMYIAARFNNKEFYKYRRGTSVFLYNFAVIIGSSVSILPKTRRVRMFFLILIIFQIFYVAFYQSLLTSELSTQKFYQEIKSIGDIVERNMSIYNQPENHRYFEHKLNKIGDIFSKLWINCENTTKCLERVLNSKNEAICLDNAYKDYITLNEEREDHASLYCLKNKVLSYPTLMIMRKTLPFRRRIDEIIGRVVSSGLIHKWTSSLFHNRSKETFAEMRVLSGILGFNQLKEIFILVGVGFSCAWTVFVLELLYFLLSGTK